MSTKPKNGNRRGRRKGGPHRFSQPVRPDRPTPPCAMCGEPIKDITSALGQGAEGNAIHFDCALKSAEADLKPGGGEKVIYLGHGRFAVVDMQSYKQRRLKVVRVEDWESHEEKFEWRTNLRLKMLQ